jgi:hypothetical protein
MSEIPGALEAQVLAAARKAIADHDAAECDCDRTLTAIKAAYSLIRQATADEIIAEIKAEMETYFAGLFDPALDEAADRAVEVARRVGGGGGGGQ